MRVLLDDPIERLLMTLAITDWAETLSVALPEARRPFSGVAATPGARQLLPAGEALLARGGATCVRVHLRHGAARLGPGHAGDAPARAGSRSPATPGWRPETRWSWRRATSSEALRGDPASRPLDHLYGLLMAGLLDRYGRADRQESQRLPPREADLRRAFARTLARQAGVLEAADARGAGRR